MIKFGKPVPSRAIPQQVTVDMTGSPPIACPFCQCTFWVQAFQIRKLSAIDPQNPTKKDQYPTFPVYVCRECGEPFKKPE